MSTDFNLYLQKFFTDYLHQDYEHSALTIESYSKTFSLFLKYIRDYEKILVHYSLISFTNLYLRKPPVYLLTSIAIYTLQGFH